MLFSFLIVLLLLLFSHALADYPLQGDFLSRAKNQANPIPGVPWGQALAAHVIIHAGFVFVVVAGSIIGLGWLYATSTPRALASHALALGLMLAVVEAVVHALTDYTKCAQRIGFNADQTIHVACKVVWALVVAAVLMHAAA